MAAISNWSHDPSNLFKPTEQNYSAKYLNTSLYPRNEDPASVATRQRSLLGRTNNWYQLAAEFESFVQSEPGK